MPLGAGWGAVIGAGIGLISSSEQSGASGKAAGAEVQVAQIQQQQANTQFNALMANAAPFISGGQNAFSQLTAGFSPGGQFTKSFSSGDFTSSPEYAGYQFQKQQGDNAIKAQGAAQGKSLAPSTALAESQFNQGLAGTSYQNWYDQAYQQWFNQQQFQEAGLTDLAKIGESATVLQGNAGAASTTAINSALSSEGNAIAQNAINQGNITSNALGNISQNVVKPIVQAYNSNSFSDPGAGMYQTSGGGGASNPYGQTIDMGSTTTDGQGGTQGGWG